MARGHGETQAAEHELSEHGDEEQEREELEREVETVHEKSSERVREAMAEITTSSGEATLRIERLTVQLPAVDRAFGTERARDTAKEQAADPDTGASDKQAKEEAVETTLKEAAGSIDARDPTSEQKAKEKKEASLRRQLMLLSGALLFGPKLLGMFEAMVQGANGNNIDHLIKDAGERAKLINLLRAIEDESDEKFWGDIADFAERNQSTLAELVYFMQYIMLVGTLQESFTWENWSEESAKVEELITTYNESTNAPKTALLKKLPTVTQNDMPVPRYIQASLGQLALGHIVQTKKKETPSGPEPGEREGVAA